MLRKVLYSILLMPTLALSIQAQPLCPTSGFEILLEGFDLRPNGDFLHYAAIGPFPTTDVPVSLIEHKIKKVIPTYQPGFGIGIGYLFPCSSNDLKAHWQHLDTHNENSVAVGDDEIIEVPFVLNGSLVFENAKGQVDFRYDAVDLDLGHSIRFFDCFQTRFYTGVRYAHIERDFNVRLEQSTMVQFPLRSLDVTTDLSIKGIGPQVGLNTTYYFASWFGIETDLSIAGIFEKTRTRTEAIAEVNTGGPDTFTITNIISPDNQTRVVPAIEGRLGAQVRYQFCNGTIVKASAGYQFADYIGAFSEVILATGMSGISSIDFRKIDAEFSGPYLRLSVKI